MKEQSEVVPSDNQIRPLFSLTDFSMTSYPCPTNPIADNSILIIWNWIFSHAEVWKTFLKSLPLTVFNGGGLIWFLLSLCVCVCVKCKYAGERVCVQLARVCERCGFVVFFSEVFSSHFLRYCCVYFLINLSTVCWLVLHIPVLYGRRRSARTFASSRHNGVVPHRFELDQ